MRRAIDAHVVGCTVCQRTRDALPGVMPVFAAFVAVPPPFVLKGEIWRDIAASWAPGALAVNGPVDEPAMMPALLAADADFSGGLPPPPFTLRGGSDAWKGRAVMFAAAAAGFLLFALTAGVILASVLGDDGPGSEAGASDGTTTAPGVSTAEATPGISLPTATPFTPSATPDVTETATSTPAAPTPPPAPTAPPPPPATATPAAPPTQPPIPSPTRDSLFGLPSRTPRPGD
jgi:hypothetical protein